MNLPARLRALLYSGQCSNCGGWFDDWTGGTCDACRNLLRKQNPSCQH